MKIAILEHPTITSIEIQKLALPEMLPNASVTSIISKHLTHHALSQYDMLIFPGIKGEESPYPEILSAKKKTIIDDLIKNSGLILWTECAPTYQLFDHYDYLHSNGEIKQRKGSGLLKGTATGPAFQQKTRHKPPQTPSNRLAERFNHHVISTITSNRSFERYQALDVNGPSLHPSSDNLEFREIFRYACLPDQPICGLIQPRGKGLLIAFSFHAALPFSSLPFAHQGKEENRLLFLQHKATLIKQHIATKERGHGT